MSFRHMLQFVLISCILVVFVTCDVDKDKEKCANELVGLATCLPYVSGQANAPPPDCCTGLKQVMQRSPECICILVKDRNDPSLGLQINATRALSLPTHCKSPGSISECPSLLHLAPNSPDAKVFDDFANGNKSGNATASATAPAAASASASAAKSSNGRVATDDQTNDGGNIGKTWLAIEMVPCLLLVTVAVAHNWFNF